MPNPVVHFEIMGQPGPKLARFYRSLLGWPVEVGGPVRGYEQHCFVPSKALAHDADPAPSTKRRSGVDDDLDAVEAGNAREPSPRRRAPSAPISTPTA